MLQAIGIMDQRQAKTRKAWYFPKPPISFKISSKLVIFFIFFKQYTTFSLWQEFRIAKTAFMKACSKNKLSVYSKLLDLALNPSPSNVNMLLVFVYKMYLFVYRPRTNILFSEINCRVEYNSTTSLNQLIRKMKVFPDSDIRSPYKSLTLYTT